MTSSPEDYAGTLPDGWAGGQHVSKWWRGKIMHLYTLRRPCAECGAEMRIDVTRAALDGKVNNAGLHLKRCKTCRAKSKALGTVSRPHVEGEGTRLEIDASVTVDEALRTANATMKAELDGLYAEVRELRERIARYELAPAMESIAANDAERSGVGKMPWDAG